jgi:hypothetical protein
METAVMESQTMPNLPLETEPKVNNDLGKRAFLLRVKFHSFGNSRKLDARKIQTDADKSMLRASKKLLDSPELDAIRTSDGEIKRTIYDATLPGFDDGLYFVPKPKYRKLEADLRQYANVTRPALIAALRAAYPARRQEAERLLGSEFNPKNYPSEEAIEEEFGMEWNWLKMSADEGLQDLDPEAYERECQKMAGQMRDATQQIIEVQRGMFLEMLTRLRTGLQTDEKGNQRIFKNTTVEKFQQWLSDYNVMNIGNDPELPALVQQARAALQNVDAQELRDYEGVRGRVRRELDTIAEELQKTVINKPVRKVR